MFGFIAVISIDRTTELWTGMYYRTKENILKSVWSQHALKLLDLHVIHIRLTFLFSPYNRLLEEIMFFLF